MQSYMQIDIIISIIISYALMLTTFILMLVKPTFSKYFFGISLGIIFLIIMILLD